jgi:ribosomal protein S27E
MSTAKIGEIEIGCGSCGSDQLAYDDEMAPDSEVKCANCGAFIGTVAGLQTLARNKAISALPDIAETIRKQLGLSV